VPAAIGSSVIRAAAVIPVTLLVVFLGLLWLLGLACGKDRRTYVLTLSKQVMGVIGTLMHGRPAPDSRPP
jgi:hypothetical protein